MANNFDLQSYHQAVLNHINIGKSKDLPRQAEVAQRVPGRLRPLQGW